MCNKETQRQTYWLGDQFRVTSQIFGSTKVTKNSEVYWTLFYKTPPSISSIAMPACTLFKASLFSSYFLLFLIRPLSFIYYFWLHWVSVVAHGLSLVVVSRGYSLLQCASFSLWWLLSLQSRDSRHAGSIVMARALSCPMTCGIFLEQRSNPCPLHWLEDS